MKRVRLCFLVIFGVICSCKEEKKELAVGDWWAKMDVSDNDILPFNFSLFKNEKGDYNIEMYNAEEVVFVDEIEIRRDSIHIQMPIFEGYIAGTFTSEEIEGEFIKESLDRVVPFSAFYGKRERFKVKDEARVNISGVWETYFDINTEKEYPAKGIFMQDDNVVKGTFRTKTGDYRFLEGIVSGDSLKLSTFDGSKVYLFTAKVTDSTLEGKFFSGNHSVENFMGIRNEAFDLPDANSLTFLKEGYDQFDFAFPDERGNIVRLSDQRFNGKVVLVQIMGTWCTNCLDETRFYLDFFKQHPDLDVELVGLAFEYAKTKEKALEGITRLKKRVGANYPILLAQYGTSNKQMANEKLPMLNHILSYPTTIYIDKNGEVEKIHTGFNGPATGEKYMEFEKEFSETIEQLAAMEVAAK
ncbi:MULTISPECIES: peroxiredoxin family protein [Flavobacteriaceae]|uniref:peroxiredoxin family protein n=1 Tax=Flavobacteriaceae TaxID=49546 RepID=UPI001491BC87|nr:MULTISPECIES: TlpA disulfide reductase family protein [Allomuricauda]MDC6364916.1 TlpA disulfide reductase family protein [Muricauda sp. AC10]